MNLYIITTESKRGTKKYTRTIGIIDDTELGARSRFAWKVKKPGEDITGCRQCLFGRKTVLFVQSEKCKK